jgi:hypothetical protein
MDLLEVHPVTGLQYRPPGLAIALARIGKGELAQDLE